ncbi:MAG TPA: hypothetical protein ENK70_05435 [Methylophaga sp.]|nr:hypothetical protein [Methylophaga sp.]
MSDEQKNHKKKDGQITVSVTSGSFPFNLFQEWDKDCKENFGNCRWLKMWHDHVFTKKFEIFLKLFDEVEQIKQEIAMLKTKENKEGNVQTLGGDDNE